MTIEQPNAGAANLIERVKNILLKPGEEFARIDTEETDIKKLYVGYAVPLAALAAIALAVGMALFRFGAFGIYVRYSPVQAITSGIAQFVTLLAGMFVIAVIINELAPTFGSQKNPIQAHKVAVYSWTASLLAGVFSIHPSLMMLGILGLYSFFLLWVGLPKLMKTPDDKRVGYFVTVLVVGIVVFLVIGVVTSTVRAAAGGFAAPYQIGQSSTVEGEVTLPGGASIDLGQLERAAKEAEQAYSAQQSGEVVSIDPARLQALLPDSLPGGFARTEVSSSSAGAMMAGASQAEGVYERGDARIRLTVVQMGGLGALASMAGAMGVQANTENADGYERMRTENGRNITESVNRASNSATYAVIGRNGVAVSADGQNVSVDDVRAAVNAVGVERAEQLVGG